MIEKIPGVRYVINDLVVDEDYLDQIDSRLSTKMGEQKDDPVVKSLTEKYFVDSSNVRIMADVKNALLRHPRLDATAIDVKPETFEIGILHLVGDVPSEEHKTMAGEVARQVRGVRYIINDLKVMQKE
jgi:osmotically-inducible protein OsmY